MFFCSEAKAKTFIACQTILEWSLLNGVGQPDLKAWLSLPKKCRSTAIGVSCHRLLPRVLDHNSKWRQSKANIDLDEGAAEGDDGFVIVSKRVRIAVIEFN